MTGVWVVVLLAIIGATYGVELAIRRDDARRKAEQERVQREVWRRHQEQERALLRLWGFDDDELDR